MLKRICIAAVIFGLLLGYAEGQCPRDRDEFPILNRDCQSDFECGPQSYCESTGLPRRCCLKCPRNFNPFPVLPYCIRLFPGQQQGFCPGGSSCQTDPVGFGRFEVCCAYRYFG